ncbi:MAG: TadE family protein [Nocardioidaceae bacterium]
MGPRRRDESAAAVVDFVLIMVILVPLVLGIVQVGLVLHVRNTLAAAASDGARYGAGLDHSPADGAQRTRDLIDGALAGRYAEDVSAAASEVDGYPGVQVRVQAEVPALGLFGPAVSLDVEGHAVDEVLP